VEISCVPNLKYCHGIKLEGLSKTINLSQVSPSLGHDCNSGSPKYKTGVCWAIDREVRSET